MNKTKSLAIQCGIVFAMFLGVWWWVGREYKKTHPEPVKLNWTAKESQEKGFSGGWYVPEVKVYQGKWHKTYLEVIGK